MTEKEDVKAEEVETEEAAPTKSQDKKYTDADLNRLVAKEKKDWKAKLDSLKAEYDEYKAGIESKEAELEKKSKVKLDEIRKDLPEDLIELLNKLSITEQLEWLEKHPVEKKRRIPTIPNGSELDSHPKQLPIKNIF
jgi:chromosome segregation ATPase